MSLIEDTAVDAYYRHVDPYEAGVGTIVNCDVAMHTVPVGMANAGDPTGEDTEAIDIALASTGGDLGPDPAIAVSAGRDIDSVGATVGAICGALAGAERLPRSSTDPLGVQFHTTLPGFDGVSLAELTARTGAVAA